MQQASRGNVKWPPVGKGGSVDMRLKLDPAKEEKNGEHSGQRSPMERHRDRGERALGE